jgi:hypothetical protein
MHGHFDFARRFAQDTLARVRLELCAQSWV